MGNIMKNLLFLLLLLSFRLTAGELVVESGTPVFLEPNIKSQPVFVFNEPTKVQYVETVDTRQVRTSLFRNLKFFRIESDGKNFLDRSGRIYG